MVWVVRYPTPPPSQPGYVNYLDVDISATPMTSYYGSNAGWLKKARGGGVAGAAAAAAA